MDLRREVPRPRARPSKPLKEPQRGPGCHRRGSFPPPRSGFLDSRGNPTVEAEMILADGSLGRAAVATGAATGEDEPARSASTTAPRQTRSCVEHLSARQTC